MSRKRKSSGKRAIKKTDARSARTRQVRRANDVPVAASPAAAGPAGSLLEGHVGAQYLLPLLSEGEARGLPGAKVTRVAFQRASYNHPMDDVIVTGHDPQGRAATLELQAKRTIDFTAGDRVFADVVAFACRAAAKPNFDATRYQLAVAIARTSTKIEQHIQDVLKWAREYQNPDSFFHRMGQPGATHAAGILQPGHGLRLPPAQASAAVPSAAPFDLGEFLTHLVPSSIFAALASNEILQIVVFSLFLGVALARLGQRAAVLVRALDALVDVMLRITDYVMRVAPVAVFAAIASVVTVQGPGVLATYGKFIASFYLALVVLWAVLSGAGYLVLGSNVKLLLRAIREPLLLAFATASSEAAYPKTLEQLGRVGVPKRIASFVLPLGYSFNLDGSMMYCAFSLIFIAQVYGVELGVTEQITMLLLLMVTSKGLAGVPRASLVVIAASLPQFNLPEAGILLILGIDQFLDMGRTATNVVGNAVATAVVAKWEGANLQATAQSDSPTHDSTPESTPASAAALVADGGCIRQQGQ